MPATQTIRLAASTPVKVNNPLASLAQQCGVELRVNKDMKAKYQDGAFIGYEPTGRSIATVSGTPEAIATMRQRMANATAPAADEQMEVWLAELDVLAPRRASSSIDDDLRMQAYLTRLSNYSADVVHEALLHRTWPFFPSWAELKEACDELMKPRFAVQAELERAERKARELDLRARALPTDQTAVPTDEEAAARKAERVRFAEEVLKCMKNKLAEDEAVKEAKAKAALESYERFRTKVTCNCKDTVRATGRLA